MPTDTHRTIETVWKIESARVVAAAARIVRDIGVAEELAQDALVAALEQWPLSGVPQNPGAWLTTMVKRRGIDVVRRRKLTEQKHGQLSYESESSSVPDPAESLDDDTGDDLLRLIFTACHPVLSAEARVALTLRVLGGLTTDEIARAFLVSEATVAQRIVRAKRALADKKVAFEVPTGADRDHRLSSVLEVIYLIFNEGYSATSGEAWVRPALCEEALRLGRILAELVPSEAEVHGLVALMEIQASRLRARVGRFGEIVRLNEQERSRWDRLLISRGLAALDRARRTGGSRGPYLLQALIAACHARALSPGETDWARIADLYGELSALTQSPVVELNRAVAIAMAFGPEAGLRAVDALVAEPLLQGYHLLPSVRGDFLAKLGRSGEAAKEFRKAADLTGNEREREFLLRRALECSSAD